MLDNLLIQFGAHSWNPRGKQRLLKVFAGVFGTVQGVTPHGIRLEFSPVDSTYYHYFDTAHERLLTKLIAELPVGGVYVDVGANGGHYAALAAGRVGSNGLVVAVEAVPRTYIRLVNNIALNRCTNVITLNTAAGDHEGLVDIVVSSDSGISHVGKIEKPKLEQLVRVPLARLDHCLTPLLEKRTIDLLKIDVEGAEHLVLKGATHLFTEKRIKRIFLEVVPSHLARLGATPQDIFNFFDQHGYRRRTQDLGPIGDNEVFECID